MKKLSTPIEELQDSYDVVVIGSGYGGGIAASRLSRAGWNVCLLERGREFLPGEFPDTNAEVNTESQFDTALGKVGNPTGLFNYHVNDDINVLVSCGLGGTSLINANVALHPVPPVFTNGAWPQAFVDDIAHGVAAGYAHAHDMLRPRAYPQDGSYPPLDKTAAMHDIANKLGKTWYYTPINVAFEDGVNHVGVEQKACINCGDCVTGCNYRAKNTTQMNYLPDAVNHGAEIFTECNVEYIEKRADGRWLVHFQRTGTGQEEFGAPPMFVEADIVVLAAGTLGSTEIMLRSKAKGLSVSPFVGQRFSGNGDVLGFGYNTDRKVEGIGYGVHSPGSGYVAGPNIASIIDTRLDTADYRDGMSIEEGVIPGALADLMPAAFAAISAAIGHDTDGGIADRVREKARELESLLLGAYRGATANTLTYLVMSHDSGAGEMYLDGNKLRIRWPGAGDEDIIKRANAMLEKCTAALGGTYIESPIWTELFKKSLVSVHPLGGCIMGEDAASGVVNHKCQVFSGTSNDDVHTGLYVMDGAVIPTALGVNPLLTISAVAERGCALLAQDYGRSISYGFPDVIAQPVPASTVGIQFTERMSGYVSAEATPDYREAESRGKAAGTMLEFTLTIRSENIEELLSTPEHSAGMVGTVRCSLLSAEELSVTEGAFNLFPSDPDVPNTRLMKYRAYLTSQEGRLFTLHGVKYIHNDNGLDIWRDTTTLFCAVTEGHESGGTEVARGILHIDPIDFVRQLTTLKAVNAQNTAERLAAIVRFGRFFAGELFDIYGGIAAGSSYFQPDAPPRKKRPLRAGQPELHTATTDDGVPLRLLRYQGGTKGPVLCLHGLGVSSSIFATDMIPVNLVEYLCSHGYDIWLLDNRTSTAFPDTARRAFSGDEVARYDYPAAVRAVLNATGAADLQVVAHCYGSTTWLMSMLSGLQGVRSAVCSQAGTHLVAPLSTRIKTGLYVPDVLDALGVESLTAYTDAESAWFDKLFDKALSFDPTQWADYDPNPVSRRITFLYSKLYETDNLNELLYNNLHELFGVASIRQFEHLGAMVRNGTLVSADGADAYMPHLQRLALPVLFISGEKNQCFLPESTERTVEALAQANGAHLYQRQVIPGYGHIDCIFGRKAADDVFPYILRHLESV